MDSSELVSILNLQKEIFEGQVHKPEQHTIENDENSSSLEGQEWSYTPLETRQNICRIANAIRVLSTFGFNITVDVIMEIVNLSSCPEFHVLVAEKETVQQSLTKNKI
ncbi:hypothetical protein FEM48_Zijuj02G0025100 [Ziziphus jujuba var. spinosa]|uniref:Uncharacterized protein n=1 Tax=Ziziphus jujuba var. spinosa TaxID=714518 RepID=A0A978VT38_ZIZJJ|nr:hypothetical protein FEM48_Zijuj02G0025100 [Ziziphus jujuba var. spinosa]